MKFSESQGKFFINPETMCIYTVIQSDDNPKYFMLINISRWTTASSWTKVKKLPDILIPIEGTFHVTQE